MHNRIDRRFSELKSAHKKALIPFITAGDPDLKTTEAIVRAMADQGADIIELGVPFSDPMADGLVIQHASERALKAKTTLPKILKMVERVRKKTDVPLLLMGYANPILAMGWEHFANALHNAGVDAVLTVDLPPEESAQLRIPLKSHGIHEIFLVAPTSSSARLMALRKIASGFVYYVSLTGVTGAKLEVTDALKAHVHEVRVETELPVCVGFGVTTPKQAASIAQFADGVVVGSALVKLIAETSGSANKVKKAADFIRSLRRVV